MLTLLEPLRTVLPFDARVQAVLKARGAVVVEPCKADTDSFKAELDHSAIDTSRHKAMRMSFGCGNDNGQEENKKNFKTKPDMLSDIGIYALKESQLQQHLDDDWQHRLSNGGHRQPVPPQMDDRHYYKDVSQLYTTNSRGQMQARKKQCHFFPGLHKTFREADDADSTDDGALKEGTPAHRKFFRARLRACKLRNRADDAMPLVNPLFLHQLMYHRLSLPTLSSVTFDGVAGYYYLYRKDGFQFFNLHVEQMLYPFVHHQLEGESQWFIIPDTELHKLYKLAAHMYRVLYNRQEASEAEAYLMGRALLYSKQLFPPLSLLRAEGIVVWSLRLRTGQILTARGGFAHFGYSIGPGSTISVATNVATVEWLKDGLTFVLDHYAYLKELAAFMEEEEKGQSRWDTVAVPVEGSGMRGISDLVMKAINVCPPNVTCSLARNIAQDMDELNTAEEPLCLYPGLQSDKAAEHKKQCETLIECVHALATFNSHCGDAAEAVCCSDRPHVEPIRMPASAPHSPSSSAAAARARSASD